MTYTLSTAAQSPNFYTPAQCLLHYFQPRSIQGITIHWWGLPSSGQTLSGVTAELCRAGVGKSAHFVAEDGRVNRIVDVRNAAWHSGSKTGNATTIGIECNPRQSDGDYRTVAELVADLRSQYGDLPLWPHNHWFATACPGTYDLARIDREARAVTASRVVVSTPPVVVVAPPAPTLTAPTLQEDEMVNAILYFYGHLFGREPGTDEVLARLDDLAGKTLPQARDWFLASRPEAGSVVMAFHDYMGHDPAPSQVAEWVAQPSVRQLRAGIAGSPEATAYRSR